ncbi:MAG: hypothetical protein IJC20_02390, partial [Clostridia bacterium]|nr:hypothetical protein [Clostridia bacterium]
MARYIDADKLIKHLEETVEECGNPDVDAHPVAYGTVLGLNGALSYARTLLATDVAKVVRCKDCNVPHNEWTGCPKLNGLIPP